ncbi:MAG: AAA family ATPase [Actinomycetota bacterium]
MSSQPEGAVTVLFTDVEGSTDLRTRLGDELADELLGLHEEIVRHGVAQHGGREIKSLGDGFMVAFASPRKAISCAVEIQRALDERNRAHPGREIRIRIGINAGEVNEIGGDLMGAAVNAASRIAGKARGGQILIANVVKDLAGMRPDLSYVDRGLYWLKGFPERWRLFEVLRRAAGPVEELTAPSLGKTRFVGREAERADLRRFVEQAADGQGGFVMIGGEPGVGKTRISEEIAEDAANRGMMALVGHCPETESGLPYAPVVEIMEATIRGVSKETLRVAFGESAPELAKMVPELKRIFPNLPPPLELPPEQERRYLFNCFTEFVERASHLQPLLFVLEDLHWADEPTLLLLQHLAERVSRMPILMLGTYRDVELDVDRPLARTLEELLRRRLAHRVNLNRLGREDVQEMLTALAGKEAPNSLVEAVYNETEGNCFFVEEVFQHLNEEGKLFDATGAWRTEVRVGEIEVPEGVRLVLGRRLARLSEGARRALSAAAVIGRNFTYEMAEALDEVGGDTLLDAIEEAQRARLLISSEDPLRPRYQFSHELVRQTLLSGLALPRRQRLHLRVADAIERVYAKDLDPHIPDLAHHLYQAGAAADPEKSVRYLVGAGDRAMQGAAFEEALRAYERAISLQSDDDVRGTAELLVKLGFAQRSLGRTAESLASWREALDQYAELDDRDAAAQACWDISYQLGWAGRVAEGMEFTQRGLMALGDARTTERAFLLASAGTFVGYLGDYEGGMALLDEAEGIAREIGDIRAEGYAKLSRSVVLYGHAEHNAIAAEAAEGEELLRNGAPFDMASFLSVIVWSQYLTGDVAGAEATHADLAPLSRRIGNQVGSLLADRFEGTRRLNETLDLDEFERFAHRDLELCRNLEFQWISNAHGFLYRAAFLQGRWEEALQHARTALETEPIGGFNGWAWPTVFVMLAHLGRRDEALAMFEQARAGLSLGEHATWGAQCIVHGAVEGLAILGETEEAAALYPEVVKTFRTGANMVRVYDMRSSALIAGIAAHAGRNWEDAERHFADAVHMSETIPLLFEAADARRLWAAMLTDRDRPGDREKARELLEHALETFRAAGIPRHVEMTEMQLKAL